MEKRNYAILTMKDEFEITKRKLECFNLEITEIEEMNGLYAMIFGISLTPEVVSKFPMTQVLIVEGTEADYLKYCREPANDVGDYYCFKEGA